MSHSLTQRYSSVIINQNQISDGSVDANLHPTPFMQEFHLSSDYRRGSESGELRYPDLSGFQLLVNITEGYSRYAAFDYELQYQVFGLGWVTSASGTVIGAPNDGQAWMTAYFEDPVEIDASKASARWRIVFTADQRPSSGEHRDVIVPYTNGQALVFGSQITTELMVGEPYSFDYLGDPAFLYLDPNDGEVYFSIQQGLVEFLITSPNPLALPHSDQAWDYDSTPLTGANGAAAFCFRALALTAEDGVDFLGNEYRSVVVQNKADTISTALGADPDSYWLSKPNPSKFAIESLYFDVRKAGTITYGKENLVLNPSFELGITGWVDELTGTASAAMSISEDWASNGTKSLKYEGTAPVGFATPGVTSDEIPMVPGRTYTLRVDANIITLPGILGWRAFIVFYNVADSALGNSPNGFVPGTGEKTFSSIGVAPAGTSYGKIFIQTSSSDPNTFKAYFDSVAVIEGSNPSSLYFDGTLDAHVWTGLPHASTSMQLLEPEIDDRATVLDRVLIDPITPGAYFAIYYSEEGEPGLNEEQWESKLWTRVPHTFRMERRETHVLPEPVKAKYLKIEFSHLQARHYAPGDFQQAIRYKKHPKWVLDYFLARMQTDAAFLSQTVSVIYDAIDLAYNYYLDDLSQEPQTVIDVSPTAVTQVKNFLEDRSDASDRVDAMTLDKINLVLNPYRTHPALRGISTTLLGDYARQTVDSSADYAIETSRAVTPTTADVSTLNRERVVVEQDYPVMFFYLTCRHKYREIEAKFSHDRAYFVGVRQIAFLRDNYMASFDTGTYIEPVADTLNVERNEFI